MPDQPPIITDAAPSLHDDQARRRRSYALLMLVHVVGFALSYPLYLWHPWVGAAAVIATGALPWVAVLIANAAPRRPGRTPVPPPTRSRPVRTAGTLSETTPDTRAAGPTVLDGTPPDSQAR